MAKSRRDRNRKPARRKPFREPKPLILVVCEGKVTEPQYFRGFTNACLNPRVDIRIPGEHGTPKRLVEVAKEYKKLAEEAAAKEGDENLAFDSVWCVFDVDEHPLIPDAIQMARDNGIHLAISNPAFELWLLLHFRDSPGMKRRDQVRELLEDFVEEYDKHVDFVKDYSTGYDDAVKRSKRLSEIASNSGRSYHDCNPSTGVFLLTELIRVP